MKKNIITVFIIIVALVIVGLVKFINTSRVYNDATDNFSVELPRSWKVVDSLYSTTTTNVQFSNGSSTIAIKRFDRTESVERAIAFMGEKEFLVFLIDQLREDIKGYEVVATSTIQIGSFNFLKVSGKYIGQKTQKEVIQNAYIILNTKDYYIIGVDVYTDVWVNEQDSIFKIINSFKVLK
jgi:hypothetical protein